MTITQYFATTLGQTTQKQDGIMEEDSGAGQDSHWVVALQDEEDGADKAP